MNVDIRPMTFTTEKGTLQVTLPADPFRLQLSIGNPAFTIEDIHMQIALPTGPLHTFLNISTPAFVLENVNVQIGMSKDETRFHLEGDIPASVLEQIRLEVKLPVGRFVPGSVRIKDGWLVIRLLDADAIKCQPSVENGKIVLQNLDVTGILRWPFGSLIIKQLTEKTKDLTFPNLTLAVLSDTIHITFVDEPPVQE